MTLDPLQWAVLIAVSVMTLVRLGASAKHMYEQWQDRRRAARTRQRTLEAAEVLRLEGWPASGVVRERAVAMVGDEVAIEVVIRLRKSGGGRLEQLSFPAAPTDRWLLTRVFTDLDLPSLGDWAISGGAVRFWLSPETENVPGAVHAMIDFAERLDALGAGLPGRLMDMIRDGDRARALDALALLERWLPDDLPGALAEALEHSDPMVRLEVARRSDVDGANALIALATEPDDAVALAALRSIRGGPRDSLVAALVRNLMESPSRVDLALELIGRFALSEAYGSVVSLLRGSAPPYSAIARALASIEGSGVESVLLSLLDTSGRADAFTGLMRHGTSVTVAALWERRGAADDAALLDQVVAAIIDRVGPAATGGLSLSAENAGGNLSLVTDGGALSLEAAAPPELEEPESS